MRNCTICNENGNYKCPTCLIYYCSATCCKKHRETKCEIAKNLEAVAHKETVKIEYPTEDTVPVEKLKLLDIQNVYGYLKYQIMNNQLIQRSNTSEQKFTLVFVKNENSALLGMKKRGFGVGKWNGYGGKVENDENVIEGAIRELKEESNLEVDAECLKYLGYVCFRGLKDEENRIVYIFTTKTISGILQESEEMRPKWFRFEDVPYDDMWPDSKFWLPMVFEEKYFCAEIMYDEEWAIARKVINVLTKVPDF